jgi:hypothetical protein
VAEAVHALPAPAGTPAYDADGVEGDGAAVAELTGLLDLRGWPPGMRVIARRERPHPGAQLRLTDIDGNRSTVFATHTVGRQLGDLKLRHRRWARGEDRIRWRKDTGMRNLPYHDSASHRIWLEIVQLAADLLAWTQALALTGTHRVAEPQRLRLRLFAVAGRLIRTACQHCLPLDASWPWAQDLAAALLRLPALVPG